MFTTSRLKKLSAISPSLSETLIKILCVPTSSFKGVPESSPSDDIESQDGSLNLQIVGRQCQYRKQLT